MTLGEKIRLARKKADLKQAQLASQVGVTDRAVRFWEADERDPSFANVVAVARATGFAIDYFADGESL